MLLSLESFEIFESIPFIYPPANYPHCEVQLSLPLSGNVFEGDE